VDLRAAWANRDESAVCSRHIDRQHNYTVLRDSLFFGIIMIFVSNVIDLLGADLEIFHSTYLSGRVPYGCG
jgi:hypothetical protein